MNKYHSAVIVFLSVTLLALLGFFISYGNHRTMVAAGLESSALAAWFALVIGLLIAGVLAAYLVYTTKSSLVEEQLRHERHALETRLVTARKIETMAHLVGGIAHDFNNILMTVSGYAGLALAKAEDSDDTEMLEYLNLVSLSADNGTALIRKLLSISRSKSYRRGQVVDFMPAISGTMNLLGQILPGNITMQADFAGEIPTVQIDSLALEQIVTVLVINATEAIEGNGTIRVALTSATVSDERCNACQKAFAGEFVRLIVSDTGKGFPPEHLDEAFLPFYSTKGEGYGAGLGLALVQNLVHGLGGHIGLASVLGKGMTVTVFLPSSPTARGEPGQ